MLRSHQSVPALRQVKVTKVIPTIPTTTASSTSDISRNHFTQKGPALLQPAFQELSVRKDVTGESSAFDETDDALGALPTQQTTYTGKRSRRGGKGRRQDQLQDYSTSRLIPTSVVTKKVEIGKNHKKNHRGGPSFNNGYRDDEGWATEDINDIRETEFDFQGNLDRFDKKTVFSQIRV